MSDEYTVVVSGDRKTRRVVVSNNDFRKGGYTMYRQVVIIKCIIYFYADRNVLVKVINYRNHVV